MTGREWTDARDGRAWVVRIYSTMSAPRLSELQISFRASNGTEHWHTFVDENHSVPPTDVQLQELLDRARG